MEIDEIGVDELHRLVDVRNTVWPHDPETVEGYVDWRAQADDMIWLLASRDGEVVGAGTGIVGWHSPAGVGRATVLVEPESRGVGTGAAILSRLASWLRERGCDEATGGVSENDEASIAWAARRGFTEVGRNSILALDLAAANPPTIAPPADVEIVAWSELPELARSLYDVYLEAAPDVPGEADAEIAPFEEWLVNDMQGASDRADATFVALHAGNVVGYAKLSMLPGVEDVAWHALTAVRRSARERGIAGALERSEIAWRKPTATDS